MTLPTIATFDTTQLENGGYFLVLNGTNSVGVTQNNVVYVTVIGDDAFIGSDTQLVAPVEVGAGATIAAGSTITRNAPADQLTLSRVPQVSKPGWKRPTKKPKG